MISFQQLGQWGRLGNQMYEYAALLGIGAELGYDVAIPAADRHQLAGCFAITAPVLRRRDLRRIKHVHTEPTVGWSDAYRSIRDGTDLRGFFQSPRYFPDREVVRREFSFHAPIRKAAEAAEQRWRALAPDRALVGVTVRRGDYQLHPEQFVPLWSTGFYDRAMTCLRDLLGPGVEPQYLVSSDEPDWCRSQFVGDDVHVIGADDGIDDVAQLALLARCDHLIIANSSYSWWAAWLNDARRRPGEPIGSTIAAARWWGDDCAYPEATREALPSPWVTVD